MELAGDASAQEHGPANLPLCPLPLYLVSLNEGGGNQVI